MRLIWKDNAKITGSHPVHFLVGINYPVPGIRTLISKNLSNLLLHSQP